MTFHLRNRFGVDKPDTRFGLELINGTKALQALQLTSANANNTATGSPEVVSPNDALAVPANLLGLVNSLNGDFFCVLIIAFSFFKF